MGVQVNLSIIFHNETIDNVKLRRHSILPLKKKKSIKEITTEN